MAGISFLFLPETILHSSICHCCLRICFSKLLYKILPPLVYDIWLGVGAIWFAFLVYFILTLLLIDIVRLFDTWFHFFPAFIQKDYELTKRITAVVAIAVVSLIVFLGNLNKRDITVKLLSCSFQKEMEN